MSHSPVRTLSALGAAAVALTLAPAASADVVEVTIENMSTSGGFYFTPFWIAAHDGSFNSYDRGGYAWDFSGITELAENGATGPLAAAFAAAVPGGMDATVTADSVPAPVFSPGESATMMFDVGDGSMNRYFSYASMVVPSNDLFVANDDPMAHMLFDASGAFMGPITIDIYGSHVNDNGTEVNDAMGDAAFSTLDGQSHPEFNAISALFDDPGAGAYLDSFVGTEVATGDIIGHGFTADDLIARITIVPAPAAFAAFAVFGFGAARRRRV